MWNVLILRRRILFYYILSAHNLCYNNSTHQSNCSDLETRNSTVTMLTSWLVFLPPTNNIQITAHLHSLFELIPGSSDWLCISTFDLIGFLVQQFLPVLLRPAHLADPGSWRVSRHRAYRLGGFINSEDIQYICFKHFPLIARAGERPTCHTMTISYSAQSENP